MLMVKSDPLTLIRKQKASGAAKFATGTTSGPKLYVVLSIKCGPALYITPPSGPAGRLFCLLQFSGVIRCSLDSLRMFGYFQHCLPVIC